MRIHIREHDRSEEITHVRPLLSQPFASEGQQDDARDELELLYPLFPFTLQLFLIFRIVGRVCIRRQFRRMARWRR